MSVKIRVASVAMAAALLCLPAAVLAQETHTITPTFPDQFKVRTVQVTDQSQETSGASATPVVQTTRMTMAVTSEIQRVDAGFKSKYAIETFDMQALNADGKPTAQQEQISGVVNIIKRIGSAEVTLDKNLIPMRIDNIEEIKAKAKDILTTAPEFGNSQVGLMIYNMMLANLTPESAASFLKQGKAQTNYFNRPLIIGQSVAIDGEPVTIMGGTFRMGGTLTLASWEAGKTAHLTYVMAPKAEDTREFMRGMMKTVVEAMIPAMEQKGGAEAKNEEAMKMVQGMLDRMVDNMKMDITMTCAVDLSLINYIDNHTVCDTDTLMDIDMKKIMPAEMLKDKPNAIDALPTMHMVQKAHMVSDTTIVQ